MKQLITAALLAFSFVGYAQDWQKYHVTPQGDTIKVGTKLLVNTDKTLKNIYPHPETPVEYKDRYKIYLTTDVPGNTFTVIKLGRIKGSTGYAGTATIEYCNKQMNKFSCAKYSILLDKAIANKEIEIVKP